MFHEFQNACQARTGCNMVKSSGPNVPTSWLIFLCLHSHASPQTCHILLLAFLLFELGATLSQCLCSESNKKNGEVGEYPQYTKIFLTNKIFLLTGYVQVLTYDFHCKMWNNNMFFHCLCSALMEKHDFYCSVIPWNCIWYCTVQVLYFFIVLLSLED